MALFLLIHSWVLYIQNFYSVEFKFVGGGGLRLGRRNIKMEILSEIHVNVFKCA